MTATQVAVALTRIDEIWEQLFPAEQARVVRLLVPEAQEPTILQAALARGHIWQRMLDDGRVKSIGQIAKKEGVDDLYIARFLNLTTLAPEIVAAILDESLPEAVTLGELSVSPAVGWGEQLRMLTLDIRDA
jgi:hypothetical protein